MSTPTSLLWKATANARRGRPTEHFHAATAVRATSDVHSALQTSHDSWQRAERAARSARQASASSPASGASRSRANLNTQNSRSSRVMYARSATPDRCVRLAFGEHRAIAPASLRQ